MPDACGNPVDDAHSLVTVNPLRAFDQVIVDELLMIPVDPEVIVDPSK